MSSPAAIPQPPPPVVHVLGQPRAQPLGHAVAVTSGSRFRAAPADNAAPATSRSRRDSRMVAMDEASGREAGGQGQGGLLGRRKRSIRNVEGMLEHRMCVKGLSLLRRKWPRAAALDGPGVACGSSCAVTGTIGTEQRGCRDAPYPAACQRRADLDAQTSRSPSGRSGGAAVLGPRCR